MQASDVRWLYRSLAHATSNTSGLSPTKPHHERTSGRQGEMIAVSFTGSRSLNPCAVTVHGVQDETQVRRFDERTIQLRRAGDYVQLGYWRRADPLCH